MNEWERGFDYVDPGEREHDPKLDRALFLVEHYLQSSGQLLNSAKLEPDWLVKQAIPAGAITYLVGKPGSKKSWLAYDLVCAVTKRRPWLQYGVPIAKTGSAMVLNFDNPDWECGRRFLRLGLTEKDRAWFHSIGAHKPPEPLPYVLQIPDGFEPLEELVYALRPDLIVVDSLRQAHTSDESSSQEMAKISGQLRQLAAYGAAVVVVHHTRKNDEILRGSTEIEASADAIVTVSENTATWSKTRGWDTTEPTITFSLEDLENSTVLKGGLSLTQLLQDGPVHRTEIASRLHLSQAAAKRLIESGLERGIIAEHRNQAGTRVIGLPE